MSACFKDYNFGKMEFVLSVYIVASVVVSILSLDLLILLSLSLLFVLVLLFLLLSLYSHYLLFYAYFNVIVVVSILPIFIIKVEPYTTCTLNDFVPCSIGTESHMFFKTKFVQRNIVN